MSDEFILIQGADGLFRKYDDDNDLTIHFNSREEQQDFIKMVNETMRGEHKGPELEKKTHCERYTIAEALLSSIYEEVRQGKIENVKGNYELAKICKELCNRIILRYDISEKGEDNERNQTN